MRYRYLTYTVIIAPAGPVGGNRHTTVAAVSLYVPIVSCDVLTRPTVNCQSIARPGSSEGTGQGDRELCITGLDRASMLSGGSLRRRQRPEP